MNQKTYHIWWSESAQSDLESIIDFISVESKANAISVFKQIKESCIKLERFPNIGRVPTELKEINIESYRELVVAIWRILYRINNNEINILAVIDSRRDIDDALLNRLLYRK
jgi:toxin ParE1/3/4